MKYIKTTYKRILENLKTNRKELGFVFYIILFLLLLLILEFLIVYLLNSPIFFLEYLWFCNTAAVLVSLFIFMKNESRQKLSSFILAVAIPAQAVWIFAYLAYIFGYDEMSRIGNFIRTYESGGIRNLIVSFIVVVKHFLVIPLTLWLSFKYGFVTPSKKYILGGILFMLIIPFLVSTELLNINCIRHSCELKIYSSAIVYDPIYSSLVFGWWIAAYATSVLSINLVINIYRNYKPKNLNLKK